MEAVMVSQPLDLLDDIKPISDFRANAAALIRQARESGRPLVITQNGRSAAVLVDVKSYQDLLDELAVLRDVAQARSELASGQGVPQSDAMARLRARVARK
jgi:prevent-host-death family protein